MTDRVEQEIWTADDKRIRESDLGRLLRERGIHVRTCPACGNVYNEEKGCNCQK